jgi:hypothetical protein
MSLISVFKDVIKALSNSRNSLHYLLMNLDRMKLLDKSVDSSAKYSILKDNQHRHSQGSY